MDFRKIYLDYNATTPLKPAVYEAMLPYLKSAYGNPSSIHWAGREAQKAMMESRDLIASLFHIDPQEVVFTSGGTEANNLAIKGSFEAFSKRGRHIVTSQVEHKSVLECLDYLKSKRGAEVSYVSVDRDGQLNMNELQAAIRPDTILISIQAANNETGVLMPIQKIGELAKEKGISFHTDAVQMIGKCELNLNTLPIDFMTVSSHKIYGPKGAGALIIRRALKLEAILHGGNQERKRRGGTENVSAIVGFGKAVSLSMEEKGDMLRVELLRNHLEDEIAKKISGAHIQGKKALRVPNTTNLTFDGVEGEGILLNLDLKGIAASSGSACSSGSLDPSHVLLAMGVSEELALSSVRFSLGYQTTKEDIETVIRILPSIISDLRKMNDACQ